jgi:hypothetical protein
MSEIGDSGRAKPEELITTENIFSYEESKHSVLMFDHGHLISSPGRLKDLE